MKTSIALPWMLGLALVPGVAAAQDGQRDLQVYQMAKDIARLEEDVKSMKRILKQLLEIDRRRVELLSRALDDDGRAALDSISRTAPEPERTPTRAPPPRSKNGTVSGRVELGSGLTAAYVYAANVRGRPVRGRTIDVVQKNRQFSPQWAVIQKGTTVRFPNQDSIYHNVFSRSDVATFDLGIYRSGDKPKSFVFTKPGLVNVYCNMHSKMKSEILVVPNALYTRVNRDGSFTLKNVPRGRRKLVAWAPEGGQQEQWVTVKGGGTATAEFSLSRATPKRHMNKLNQPYGSYDD